MEQIIWGIAFLLAAVLLVWLGNRAKNSRNAAPAKNRSPPSMGFRGLSSVILRGSEGS